MPYSKEFNGIQLEYSAIQLEVKCHTVMSVVPYSLKCSAKE